MFRSRSLPALFLCAALPLAGVEGEVDKPSWHALPRETIAALRMPDLGAFVDAFEGTVLGRALTKEARLQGLRELISEASEDGFDGLLQQLEQRGFTLDDWRALVAGEIGGAAVVLAPDDMDEVPALALLAWLEPSAELGDRLLLALEQGLQDPMIPPQQRPTRIDRTLGEHAVIHLSIPRVSHHNQFEDPVPAEPQHVYLHRRGARFLLASGSGPVEESEIEQVFGRFLAAHDGADGAFAGRVLQAQGVHNGIPIGTTLLDAYGDLSTLWTLLAAEEDLANGMGGQRFLEASGLDACDLMSLGVSLDGGLLRSNTFIGMPAPRRGIPAMLELPQHPAEPAAWVPASTQEYSLIGIDPLKLYTQIKELAFAIGGEEAMRSFQMADGGVMGMAGVDLPTLLGAFGTRIDCLAYPVSLLDPEQVAAEMKGRFGMAIEVADPELIAKVLRSAAMMSGGQLVDEQGFQGFRLPQAPDVPPGGLFLGHGRLVFAMGTTAVEQTLAAIRNPPDGDASLRNAPLIRRAAQLLAPQPAIAWSIQDIGAKMRVLIASMPMVLLDQAPGDPEGDAAIRRIIELMPPAEDWATFFGLGVSQIRIDQLGLTIESVSELPLAAD